MTQSAQIQFQGVTKRFGGVIAANDLSFAVKRGSLTALLGPSGCGKTTTLRLIAGLEAPDAGSVWLQERQVAGDGVWIPPELRRVGMVFQDGALFPHLTIAQNIAFPLKSRNSAERVHDLMCLVGLNGMEARYPHQLSGGQQQRIALARALAANPDVILLDEPFSRLDAALRMSLREEVQQIVSQVGATTVFVTHDQEEAMSIADHIVVMFEGRIVQIGTPQEIYTRPATRALATFIGEANLLPGRAQGAMVECALGRLLLATHHDGEVDVMIRPEAIEMTPARSGQARIERIRYFGHDQVAHLRLQSGILLDARSLPRPDLEVGEQVNLSVRGVVVAYPR